MLEPKNAPNQEQQNKESQDNITLLIVDCAFNPQTGEFRLYEVQPLQESDLALHSGSVKTYHEKTDEMYKICLNQLFGEGQYYYQQKIPPHILTCRKDLKISSEFPIFAVDHDSYDKEVASRAKYHNTYYTTQCRYSETDKSIQRILFYKNLPKKTREAILPRFKIYCVSSEHNENEGIIQDITQGIKNNKTGIVFKCSDGTAGQGNVFLTADEVTATKIREILQQFPVGQLFNVEETVQIKEQPPYTTYRLLMAYSPQNLQNKIEEFFNVTMHSGDETYDFDSHGLHKRQLLFFADTNIPYLSKKKVKIDKPHSLSNPQDPYYHKDTAENLKLIAQTIFQTNYEDLKKQLLTDPQIDAIVHKSAKSHLIDMCSIGMIYGTRYTQQAQFENEFIHQSFDFTSLIDFSKPLSFNKPFFANDIFSKLKTIIKEYPEKSEELRILTAFRAIELLDTNRELYKALLDNILKNGSEFTITDEKLKGLIFIARIFNDFHREDLEVQYLNTNLSHIYDFKKYHSDSAYERGRSLNEQGFDENSGFFKIQNINKIIDEESEGVRIHEQFIAQCEKTLFQLSQQNLVQSYEEKKKQVEQLSSQKKDSEEKVKWLTSDIKRRKDEIFSIRRDIALLEAYQKNVAAITMLNNAKMRFTNFIRNGDLQTIEAVLSPTVITMLRNQCSKIDLVTIFGARNIREMKENISRYLKKNLKFVPDALQRTQEEDVFLDTIQPLVSYMIKRAVNNKNLDITSKNLNITAFKKDFQNEFMKRQKGISIIIYQLLEQGADIANNQTLQDFTNTLCENIFDKRETMEISFLCSERIYIARNMAIIAVKNLEDKNNDFQVLSEYFEKLLSKDVNLYTKIVSTLKITQNCKTMFASDIVTSIKNLTYDIKRDRREWISTNLPPAILPLTMLPIANEGEGYDFYRNSCSMQRYVSYFQPEKLIIRQIAEVLGQEIADKLFTQDMSAARREDAEKIKQHLLIKVFPELLKKDQNCLKNFDFQKTSDIIGDLYKIGQRKTVNRGTLLQLYYDSATSYTAIGLLSGGVQLDESKLNTATNYIVNQLAQVLSYRNSIKGQSTLEM